MITDNGKKIEANANGGISTYEPYVVLGVARRSDGWTINYINSNAHGKTNMWSYHKPVRHSNPGELTEAQFCAEDGNFGLSIPSGSSDLKTLYKSASWVYLPPNRAQDHQRDLDWDGYNNVAIPMVASGWRSGQEIQIDLFQGGVVTVGAKTPVPGERINGKRTNLTLEDFRNTGGDALYYAKYCVAVYRIPSGTDKSKWDDTSLWSGPEQLTVVNFDAQGNETTSTGTVATSSGATDYAWAGYAYARFRINSMPATVTDDTRPIYVLVAGLYHQQSKKYYPLPTDSANAGYVFMRPYQMAWVKVTAFSWCAGVKRVDGTLVPTPSHIPSSGAYLPANWDGTAYGILTLDNQTSNQINIGHHGSGAQTQFRIETTAQGGTQTVWIGGRLVNANGTEITSQTINPNTSPTHSATVYLRFDKAVTNFKANQLPYQGVFPIQVSHDSGRSFTTLQNMLVVISK